MWADFWQVSCGGLYHLETIIFFWRIGHQERQVTWSKPVFQLEEGGLGLAQGPLDDWTLMLHREKNGAVRGKRRVCGEGKNGLCWNQVLICLMTLLLMNAAIGQAIEHVEGITLFITWRRGGEYQLNLLFVSEVVVQPPHPHPIILFLSESLRTTPQNFMKM